MKKEGREGGNEGNSERGKKGRRKEKIIQLRERKEIHEFQAKNVFLGGNSNKKNSIDLASPGHKRKLEVLSAAVTG